MTSASQATAKAHRVDGPGTVNIRPGVGILGLFPAMNYKAWYALGELVDNALDSYLTHKERLRLAEGEDYRLRVVVKVDGSSDSSIRVWDNAAGIDAANYERAFKTADPPTESAGLSEFGIGMKSASCWFAGSWSVRTTALGEGVERLIHFDVQKIIRDQSEELVPEIVDAHLAAHSTEIRLWDLHRPPAGKTVAKMRRHLASMYRHFLRNGELTLVFNDEELRYDDPSRLVAPFYRNQTGPPETWEKPINFTLETGERVEGFAGLRETGSTKLAGLALFRNGRLIVGSDDETYRPAEIFGGSNSYRYQRLFGELQLNDFNVSHTKDGFIWEDSEQEFLSALKEALDTEPLPLLEQAEGYRAKRASQEAERAAARAVENTARVLPEAAPVIERQVEDEPDAGPPTAYRVDGGTGTQTLDLRIKGVPWRIEVDVTSDPAATDWLVIVDSPARDGKADSKTRQLGIRLSLSHPFTQRFGGATSSDIEGLVRLAAGLAMAEITAREAGVKQAGTVRRNLNELLSGALSKQ